ncbi:thiamine-phosphate kinase [Thermogymnomonas acidicola]|uniref:thiamine-phosphate kinase n=1 Tax=Thermogymnomonas acidicola TaxID=399579 RepID=UPI001396C88C|nr:thiamine-phosphate kinase [Thermogymnomonas acidicola]
MFSRYVKGQSKDDCAVVPAGRDYLLISTDSLNESGHFPDGTTPEMAGRFFATVNLSDIAAMAGIPLYFVTAYTLREDVDMDYLERFEESMSRQLRRFHTELLGGDLKQGQSNVFSGTIIGRQRKSLTTLRSRIRKGQLVAVTNTLGEQASGYIFYKHGYSRSLGLKLLFSAEPRVKEALKIAEHGGAQFMMDLSDGLFSSIAQVKHDYGIGFKIVGGDDIPAGKHVDKASFISGLTRTEIACNFGGGEYELLFTVPQARYREFAQAMEDEGISVTFIGETWDGDNIIFENGSWRRITQQGGYEHFMPKPA